MTAWQGQPSKNSNNVSNACIVKKARKHVLFFNTSPKFVLKNFNQLFPLVAINSQAINRDILSAHYQIDKINDTAKNVYVFTN